MGEGAVLALDISLVQLRQITNGQLQVPPGVAPDQISAQGISTDTRSLLPHDVFLALRGEHFDGHRFVPQAIAAGAVGLVVEETIPEARVPLLVVESTLAAYQAIARWWRRTLQTPLVAITGSVGKTTTKELIAAALSLHGSVLKTQANYNNEIGVPKTLLALEPHHRYGVIEMGMRGPGEIRLLAQTAEPDVAIITNVGTAHIGRLGSEQAIADAKCELLAELSPGGIAVLNHDNARLMQTAKGVWSGSLITFGLEGGDIHGRLVDEDHLEVNGVLLPLPLPGQHNAANLLAAIAVMEALNLDWQALQQGLAVDLPGGRARRLTLAEDIVVLDETYNAGVESMMAALQLLKETPGQRHIAVLGTMKELGDHSLALHEQVGATVKQLGIDQLLVMADPDEAKAMAAGATSVPTQLFTDKTQLADALRDLMKSGDRILFKASRSVGLDAVVSDLISQEAMFSGKS